jgi:hypothetical protein
MTVIRVTNRPNLEVVLAPEGFGVYSEKRARIDELLRQGIEDENRVEREF